MSLLTYSKKVQAVV